MLSDFGHFIGVRGDGNQSDFRTFTCYTDNVDIGFDIGGFFDGATLDASQVFDHCGCVKPRDRFIIYPKLDGVVHPTATYATCIEATKADGKKPSRCYLIPHKENEFVAFKKINTLGTLDGGVVSINLPCLGHINKVGVIACDGTASNNGEQNINVGIGRRTEDSDNQGFTLPGAPLAFRSSTIHGRLSVKDVCAICSRVVFSGNANPLNTGEAIAFCVYDTNVTLCHREGNILMHTQHDVSFRFPETIYAIYLYGTSCGTSFQPVTGDGKFALVEPVNETNISNRVGLNGIFSPASIEVTNLRGKHVKIDLQVADSSNVRAASEFNFYFGI